MKESSTIADASQPNAGRIYDYFLGGNHNFEVDRQAAQQVLKFAPYMPKYLMLVRWFLGEATRRLCAEGFNKFLDFASGLPTMDHIHQVAPEGTKVIYSDIDPVTVAYAMEIIGDNPNIRYVHCDAAKPEELINSGVIEELFGTDRKIAIGMNGILWFLKDDEVEHSLRFLYDWANEGSKLFLTTSDSDVRTEEGQKFLDVYQKVGQELHLRPLKMAFDLIKPWTIDAPGVKQAEEWIDIKTDLSEQVEELWGSGTLYAMILKK